MTKLFAVLLTLVTTATHDIKLAVFEIQESEAGLALSVTIDREDFFKELAPEIQKQSPNVNFYALATSYFNDHVRISVDGNNAKFRVLKMEYSDEMAHISGTLNLPNSKVGEVKMSNTCLVSTFSQHENIMKLKLNGRVRSFRLTKEHTATVATYNS